MYIIIFTNYFLLIIKKNIVVYNKDTLWNMQRWNYCVSKTMYIENCYKFSSDSNCGNQKPMERLELFERFDFFGIILA